MSRRMGMTTVVMNHKVLYELTLALLPPEVVVDVRVDEVVVVSVDEVVVNVPPPPPPKPDPGGGGGGGSVDPGK